MSSGSIDWPPSLSPAATLVYERLIGVALCSGKSSAGVCKRSRNANCSM
jgi:hypothetical protein